MSYASKTPNSLLYFNWQEQDYEYSRADERRNRKKGDKECGIREERSIE